MLIFGDLCRADNVGRLKVAYDAVMHEIRSHSATVYWQQPTSELVGISDFGYSFVDGAPRRIRLDLS